MTIGLTCWEAYDQDSAIRDALPEEWVVRDTRVKAVAHLSQLLIRDMVLLPCLRSHILIRRKRLLLLLLLAFLFHDYLY